MKYCSFDHVFFFKIEGSFQASEAVRISQGLYMWSFPVTSLTVHSVHSKNHIIIINHRAHYWIFLSSFQVASPLTKLRVTNSSMMSNLKVSKFTAPHHQVLWSQLNLYKSIPIAPILLLPIPKICCSVLKARLRESQTKSSANVGNISIEMDC